MAQILPQANKLVRALASQIGRTLESPDADAVHDLRVAIRRYSQLLTALDSAPKPVRRRLKALMHFAGDVRDCDISSKLVRKAGASQTLLRRLVRRRGIAERLLVVELQTWKDSAGWRTPLNDGSPDRRLLDKALKRVLKRAKAAEKSDKQLHPLRIAAKKLRYTMELVAPADSRMELIRELQRQLGDINDYETAWRMAGEEAAPRRLIVALHERRDKKIRSFRRCWRREFNPGLTAAAPAKNGKEPRP